VADVILWQIGVSHFSEKVRWALDYKGVEYERRAPMPSAHMAVALWLTRGRHKTLPIVQFDGETIADSTAIIGALEQRHPEPALYPSEPVERRRALDLEEFFDEELGPQIRQFAWHEVGKEPELYAEILRDAVPAPLRRLPASDRVLGASGKAFTSLRYRANDDALAEESKTKVLALSIGSKRSSTGASISWATRSQWPTSRRRRCSIRWCSRPKRRRTSGVWPPGSRHSGSR
jgi:glutathione S-transferase